MSFEAYVLAGLNALAVFTEDRAPELAEQKRQQYAAIASAVASVAGEQKIARRAEWASLIVAIGYAESGFSLRIMDGRCKPWECDRGRARGGWQVHRYAEAA